MPPHRNVPATTPSIKPIKAERTIRSHEENQERAYIAASRRSDRSLEARVESARRASDIHKKRTGRALRVTEQDVMNEEMYEEEDDDIPWRYRSVTSHLPLEDGLLSRRLQSMLAVQLENQRLLGQAVNSTLQHNPQYGNQGQYISPGMMQMPQNLFSNPMLPPQQLNRAGSYRQSPYPLQQNQQQMSPHTHQRSASVATPQASSMQQYNQSVQNTPQQHDRRMSLPQQSMQQPVQPLVRTPSGYASSRGSVPTSPVHQHQPSTSPDNRLRPASNAGLHSRQPTPQQENNFFPLTTTLPLDTQQMLAGAEGYPTFDMFGSGQDYPMKPQQPFYSYRPNLSGGSMKGTPSTTSGLDQTLLGGTLDTKVGGHGTFADTPTSANSSYLNSAATDQGFGFGYDGSLFGMDQFGTGSGMTSGQITPGNASGYNEPLFNDFLDQDMFGEQYSSQA